MKRPNLLAPVGAPQAPTAPGPARDRGAGRRGARITLAWIGLALCAAAPTQALQRGTTDLGRAYISGGVGAAEQETLRTEGKGYGLAILTAARGSGDFLADVHVHITDAQSRTVLDTVMDGPWLLVDLPAGRYAVEATRNGRVQQHTVEFLANGRVETVFYFDNHLESDALAP